MHTAPEPTIRGIFVMSHVNALEEKKGHAGIVELMARYGKSIRFGNLENVPAKEESDIIEHVLNILTDDAIPHEERAYEAGKLHFENFSHTELGSLVLPLFRSNIKAFLMGANHIAQYVFHNLTIRAESERSNAVHVTMENSTYPIEHFQGFFEALLEYGGLKGKVDAQSRGERRHAYDIRWEEK